MTDDDSKKTTRVTDESSDRAYFTISPRIVWALCRNPFDFALWQTVKDIAGDARECFISTRDLATLSMMSAGQTSNSRKHLVDAGLLEGEVRRDPGYQLPVWHLRVPDLWERSTAWALKHKSIKDRIAFKKKQQDDLRAARQAAAEQKEKEKGCSQDDIGCSPGEQPYTCSEQPTTPGEQPYTPGELKNIKQEEQQEEPKESFIAQGAKQPSPKKTKAAPPPSWGADWQMANGGPIVLPTADEQRALDVANALNLFHQSEQPFVQAFYEGTGILPLKADVAYWRQTISYLRAKSVLPAHLTEAARRLAQDDLTVSSPKSLQNAAVALAAREKKQAPTQPPAPLPPLRQYTPPPAEARARLRAALGVE